MNKINLKQIDSVSKVIVIILVAIVGYFLIFLIMSPLLIPRQTTMMQMMNGMMPSIMNFSTTNSAIINLISLFFSVGLALLISLYLFRTQIEDKEYKLIKKVLSEDQKRILDEIKKAKEITQDSLRFRLGWSKAKISTILTNLDKRGIIQRERIGKTYKVYLQKI